MPDVRSLPESDPEWRMANVNVRNVSLPNIQNYLNKFSENSKFTEQTSCDEIRLSNHRISRQCSRLSKYYDISESQPWIDRISFKMSEFFWTSQHWAHRIMDEHTCSMEPKSAKNWSHSPLVRDASTSRSPNQFDHTLYQSQVYLLTSRRNVIRKSPNATKMPTDAFREPMNATRVPTNGIREIMNAFGCHWIPHHQETNDC